MCQQRLARLADSEGDCGEVVAGGLQSQSVQCHAADHRLAVRERAETDRGGQGSGENIKGEDEFSRHKVFFKYHDIIWKNKCLCKHCITFVCHCAKCFSVYSGVHSPWQGCGN